MRLKLAPPRYREHQLGYLRIAAKNECGQERQVAAHGRQRGMRCEGAQLPPTEGRRNVREDRFDHVRVVFDAERIGNSQQ